jgi:hypothetical protein
MLLIASKVTRKFSISMFQTTGWSALLAVPRAKRLRGHIAPMFGTIAGGRSNPKRIEIRLAEMKGPRSFRGP